jgi:hypothetical protein
VTPQQIEQGIEPTNNKGIVADGGDDRRGSVIAELAAMGVTNPMRDKLADNPAITPLEVRLTYRAALKEGRENPQGWVISRLREHNQARYLMEPKEVCQLSRDGDLAFIGDLDASAGRLRWSS